LREIVVLSSGAAWAGRSRDRDRLLFQVAIRRPKDSLSVNCGHIGRFCVRFSAESTLISTQTGRKRTRKSTKSPPGNPQSHIVPRMEPALSAGLHTHSKPRPFLSYEKIVLMRHIVALNRNRRDRVIRRLHRQASKPHPELILSKVHLVSRRQHPRGLHTDHKSSNRDIIARPEIHMHIKRVALAREARIIRAARLA